MSKESIRSSAYTKVVKAINSYGYSVPIYRDIYEEDELGCKILKTPKAYIEDVKCIIDNSSISRGGSKQIVNTGKGVVKGTSHATLYAPYDKLFPIKQYDIILYEDVFYKVVEITDIVHYNILYQVLLERIDIDGE